MAVVAVLANPLVIPSLPEVLADFGQPDSRAGLIVAVVPLPGVLIAPIAGLLSDRLGRKQVVIPLLALFGLAGVSSALAQSFELFIAARFAQGTASGGLIALAAILIADNWSGSDRTRLLGYHSAAISFGLLVSPLIGGFIASRWGWRWSVGLAVIALPLAVACRWLVPENVDSTGLGVRGQLGAFRQTLRTGSVRSLLVAGSLLSAATFAVLLTAAPLFLEEQLSVGIDVRGAVLALPAVGAVLAGLAVTRLRQVVAVRWILPAAAMGMAAGSFVIASAGSTPMVAAGVLGFGLATGFVGPTVQDTLASAVPSSGRAAVLGAWTSLMRLGQAIGPLLFGVGLGVASLPNTIRIGGLALVGLAVLLFSFSAKVVPPSENPAT